MAPEDRESLQRQINTISEKLRGLTSKEEAVELYTSKLVQLFSLTHADRVLVCGIE